MVGYILEMVWNFDMLLSKLELPEFGMQIPYAISGSVG